jgi:hypothetical protein
MQIRSVLILAAVGAAALSSSARAGGCEGGACYRAVVQPPVYGVVSQNVLVRPPQVFTRTIPGAYASLSEPVLVAPPRQVWQVTYDAAGQPIGCWVTAPAQFAVQHRRVMVRPPQVVQEATPGVYANVARKVLIQPARAGWEPIGGYGGGYGPAFGYAGY